MNPRVSTAGLAVWFALLGGVASADTYFSYTFGVAAPSPARLDCTKVKVAVGGKPHVASLSAGPSANICSGTFTSSGPVPIVAKSVGASDGVHRLHVTAFVGMMHEVERTMVMPRTNPVGTPSPHSP